MIISYKPDDGPVQEYEFIPGLLMNPESEAIEAVGDYSWTTFEQFGQLFFQGGSRAVRAALWIMMKRKNPRLQFNDVSFRSNQVSVDYSPRERQLILDAMLADPDLDPAQRANLEMAVGGAETVADTETQLSEAGIKREPVPKDQPSYLGDDGSTFVPEDSPPA
jgi:hypothetical protein